MFCGLWYVKKHFGATIVCLVSAKIFFASLIAALFNHLLLSRLNYSYFIELVIGDVVFLLVY